MKVFLWWLVCFLVTLVWTFLGSIYFLWWWNYKHWIFQQHSSSNAVFGGSTSFSFLLDTLLCKYPRCLCRLFATEAGCELRLSWLSNMIHCSFQNHWLPGFSSPSCKCDLYSLFLDVWPCIWLYWDAWLEKSRLISLGLLCVTCLFLF